jgi:dTDP-glucose 4,6-dehydratase
VKKALITGIGGSIGVHMLAHIMENTDWDVIGIDSFRHKGEFDRITEVCKDNSEWLRRIEIFTHDLTSPFTNRQIERLIDTDYIIHLASLSDVQASIDDPVPFIRNNVDITLNTLELARKVKPLTFIQFSTDEVMGPAENGHGHKEWSTILPSNPYSASKAAQEAIAIAYWRSYDVPVIITNTMNNFDTMQQPNKYPVKIQRSLLNGETVYVHTASDGQIGTRFYLSSRNTASAVLFILKNLPATHHKAGTVDKPDRYNIVGDKQLSNLELAESIAVMMDKELKYELVDFHSKQPGHDLHYGLNGTKLKEAGWQPIETYEQSMQRVIKWQNDNKEWITA